MSTPASPLLSPSQLATLAAIGEERSAPVGELLYRVGDRTYPFIAILEGEVAIVDADGNELTRHGASGFLGELNLLSGQTVFVNALVTQALRYISVERAALRSLLHETAHSATSSSRPSSPAARRCRACRASASRSSARTAPNRRCGCSISRARTGSRIPGRTPPRPGAARCHSCDCPAGRVARSQRRPGAARSRDRARARTSRGGRPADRGRRPGRPRRRGLRRLRRLDTLVVEGTALGGQAGSSRRIENYLGFPAGISGTELTSRAVSQARKFNARTATPYRALSLEPGDGRHLVRLEDDREIGARASCSQQGLSTAASQSTALPSSRD